VSQTDRHEDFYRRNVRRGDAGSTSLPRHPMGGSNDSHTAVTYRLA
jgi:hypothetical protein